MKTLAAHGRPASPQLSLSIVGLLQAVALVEGINVEQLILDLAIGRAEALGLDMLARSVRESEDRQ